jgi:hypothetical protein
VDDKYKGPKLESLEGGKFGITPQFVRDMMEWFKDGGALPRRYVWEIVLGAHKHFEAEESLVNVDIEEGMTCDVIGSFSGFLSIVRCCLRRDMMTFSSEGDVHGLSRVYFRLVCFWC